MTEYFPSEPLYLCVNILCLPQRSLGVIQGISRIQEDTSTVQLPGILNTLSLLKQTALDKLHEYDGQKTIRPPTS